MGQRLRALRENADLRQDAAAEAAGISRNHLQLLEDGLSNRAKRTPANPRLATLLALCEAYETTLPQLMADLETPTVAVEVETAPSHRRSRRPRT